jgi:hypothetical protein
LFSGDQFEHGLIVESGSSLSDVEVDQGAGNAWTALTAVGASVDRVIAKGAAAGASTVVIANSTIRNSIVVASGIDGVALETLGNGNNPAGTYRNVTAIATGNLGTAIRAWAVLGSVNVLARNVIARGGPGDYGIIARAVNADTTATITVSHSNFNATSADGAGASILDGGANQTAAPAFVNAAAGDYHQAPGSPTIDAGLSEFVDGNVDIDGDPREIDTIDIGADEYVVAPLASTGLATAVTDHSATLGGSVNANGASTSYWFDYGPTTAYGSSTPATDAGTGTSAVSATATVSGLTPATTYHYRLVATNSGVTTKGADLTFTTASSPQSAPPASTPTGGGATTPSGPQPTSVFAGVSL